MDIDRGTSVIVTTVKALSFEIGLLEDRLRQSEQQLVQQKDQCLKLEKRTEELEAILSEKNATIQALSNELDEMRGNDNENEIDIPIFFDVDDPIDADAHGPTITG